MHAIWSRACQAHGSHRRACHQATNVLIRRSMSAPNRRRITMRDAFTACYTTIMATAAVVDANHKDKRRKELDRKISEAKDGLAELMEQSLALELAQSTESCFPTSHPAAAPPLSALESLYSICVKPEVLLRDRAKADRRRRRREFLEKRLGVTRDKVRWRTLPRMAELDELLVMEESRPEILQREPASSVQISRSADMINDLVDRLLFEAYRDEGHHISPAADSLDSAWNAIRMLRSDGYPRYGDPSLDVESGTESRRGLNAVNRNIIADLDALRTRRPMTDTEYKGHRVHYIAKICYNLLVSTVPPGIHNYNALISGFSRIGETSLARAVVDSFIFKSHLRPTQMTMVALLHHYRLSKDIVGFYSVIRRLIGHDPRGIGLRRRTLEEVERHRILWAWAQELDVAVVGDFVIERATFDQQLLGSLLDGLIDFKQTRHAARVFVACMQEGWATSSQYLHRIVALCISQLDRHAAETLVQGFLHHIDKVVALLLDDSLERQQSLPYNIIHLLDLLDLHKVGVAPQQNSSHISGARHHYPTRLNRLKRALWARITLYELNDTALCTKLLLPMCHSRGAHFDVDGAAGLVTAGTSRRSQRASSRRRFKMLANLDWLSEQCEKQTREARWVLFRALPARERQKLRASGDRVYTIPDMSTNKILAHWSRYLRALCREPVTVSPTSATAEARAQSGSCNTRQRPADAEAAPAFAGVADKLSRSPLQMVASA